MKLMMTKTISGLVPSLAQDRELFSKLKIGKEYVAEIKQPRNVQQLKLYWSLIHLIFPEQKTWTTKEDLSDAIKCAVGHCEQTTLKDGRIMVRPKSISFAKADQSQWEAFFDNVMELVITKILPGVEKTALKNELEAMLYAKTPR